MTAFGGAPLAPSTRGFAPPSVSQRCSTSICYLFENYCNLLLQFAKELLYTILKERDPNRQKQLFSEWIEEASESEIPSFVKCANTYSNWFAPIVNSFFCPYTNGFTEGCNNKIKVLKRNAYGLQDFMRFRNRILFMFSH